MNQIVNWSRPLMADEIRQLYRAMGAVEANTETIMSDVSDMKKDMKEIVPTVGALKTYIDQEVKPEIDGLKRARWIRHGITITLGSISGFGASVAAKIPAISALLHVP